VAVSTAAYRVVQEALSNVRRHAAPGARVEVRVSVGADGAARVEVADDGGAMPAAVAGRGAARGAPVKEGFGLVGMRERVVATGGHIQAGPVAAGGFRVIAEWPGR
jgi:signal transduction histidine kinase